MGCGFCERGKTSGKMLLDILSDFGVLWTTKKEETAALWKLYMCHEFMIP